MRIWSKLGVIVTALLSVACSVTPPKDVKVVSNFELNRYLGTWYEVARLDHSFESGLERVTANYSLRDDGGVKVINRGFNPEKNKWQESEGKGYFTGSTSRAALKVSSLARSMAAITSSSWIKITAMRWFAGRIKAICGSSHEPRRWMTV